jgi:DNA-binding NarL/FixJ family response regulator
LSENCSKLTEREEDIARLLRQGYSKSKIAHRLKVHRITLGNFIRDNCLA